MALLLCFPQSRPGSYVTDQLITAPLEGDAEFLGQRFADGGEWQVLIVVVDMLTLGRPPVP